MFNIFKKHEENSFETNASPASDYISMKNDQLIQSYHEALAKYISGVDAKWRLAPPEIDDALSVSYDRDEVAQIIAQMNMRDIPYDKTQLDKVDQEWREWLLKCIQAGDVVTPVYEMPDEPKEKWWFHIETLNDNKDEPRKS